MDTVTIHKFKTRTTPRGMPNVRHAEVRREPLTGSMYVRMVGGEAVLTRKGAEAGWVLGDVPGVEAPEPKPAPKAKPIVRKSRIPKPKPKPSK